MTETDDLLLARRVVERVLVGATFGALYFRGLNLWFETVVPEIEEGVAYLRVECLWRLASEGGGSTQQLSDPEWNTFAHALADCGGQSVRRVALVAGGSLELEFESGAVLFL